MVFSQAILKVITDKFRKALNALDGRDLSILLPDDILFISKVCLPSHVYSYPCVPASCVLTYK